MKNNVSLLLKWKEVPVVAVSSGPTFMYTALP